MSILSDIWEGVRTTLIGLRVTVPYIWRRPVTLRYPHERPTLPERTRNRLYVNMDDCIGCDQCARACPVNCIAIETAKAVGEDSPGVTSNGKRKALWVTRFDIDIAKCCYCGLCTYPCPTECIKMTDVYEFSEQERNNLIYTYVTLTPEEIVEKIQLSEEAERELAEKKKAAPAAPAAPKAAAAPAATPAAVAADPEKAAKLAALQAKMAAAKAAKEGGAAPEAPAAPAATGANGGVPNGSADDEKAARLAAMKAKIDAAKAASGAPPAEPVAASGAAAEPVAAPAPAGDDDAEKAERIAAMKAKIAEAKAKKEAGG
jgi:NADH-quinone oxidoreductase subunit I